MENILNALLEFIINWWPVLGPLLYEVIARKIPTKSNISLFDFFWKALNFLVTNRRLPQPQDNMVSPTQNTVVVDANKHILK